MWLATALSSYARRLIARYGVDEFFKTDLGRMLHDLPSFKKHVLETGLHSGAATISYVIPEAGFWGRFFNETLTDVPSEVAKNMMNGLPAGDRESLLKKILSLGEGTVKETVIWAEGLPEEELIAAKKEMERMTAQEIGVLVGSGQAEKLLGLFGSKRPDGPAKTSKFTESLSRLNDRLEEKLSREEKKA